MGSTDDEIEGKTFPAPICSRLRCGHYANGRGAWMDIERIVMPGYPDDDGGLPGVSVRWGRDSWFVPARDAEQFWENTPYEFLRDHFISENVKASRDEGA